MRRPGAIFAASALLPTEAKNAMTMATPTLAPKEPRHEITDVLVLGLVKTSPSVYEDPDTKHALGEGRPRPASFEEA
jgi:hypothetical protein